MAKITKHDFPQILKTGGILCLICFCATLLLAGGNALTKDKIAQIQKEETIAAQKKLLPADEYGDVAEGIVAAKTGGQTVGYCVSVSTDGYGGAIDMLVAIRQDGTLSGIEIISMSETPGLGQNATKDSFKEKFAGKSLPLSVVKGKQPAENEIDAITSATITTNAVAKGVNQAMELLKEQNLLKDGVNGNSTN